MPFSNRLFYFRALEKYYRSRFMVVGFSCVRARQFASVMLVASLLRTFVLYPDFLSKLAIVVSLEGSPPTLLGISTPPNMFPPAMPLRLGKRPVNIEALLGLHKECPEYLRCECSERRANADLC